MRSSTVIEKRATGPPTGGGRWAGNGSSERPPCARSKRRRRSGAAAEARDGRRSAPAESAPRPPRSRLRRDFAASWRAGGRSTAQSSRSGSRARVSITASWYASTVWYSHPVVFCVGCRASFSAVPFENLPLAAFAEIAHSSLRAPSLERGKSTARRFAGAPIGDSLPEERNGLLRTRWRSESGPARASVTPSLHRRAGPPAVRRSTTLTA